ncbi:MAG: ATP-binding cassette domain-containing protein [Acidimicrobiales bacterium]
MTGLLAFEVSTQVLLSGAMRGLAIGVMAVGMILIYRSCRVINFALGELGALCAALFVRFVVNWHWSFYAALPLMILVGALLGALLELVIVRRLYRAPRVALLVATIGAAQLLLFLQFVLPDLERYTAFPTAFTKQWVVLDDVIVRADHVIAAVVFPALVAGLGWFLNRTRTGIAVRAAADNSDAARLSAIPVKRTSTIVWALAGALASVATILSAPLAGANVTSMDQLGPGFLIRTLAAAVIASMASLPIALAAGVGLGVLEALVFYNNPTDPGLIDGVLLVVVLVAVLLMSMRNRGLGIRERFSFAPRVRPIPPSLQQVWWVRHHTHIAGGLALIAALALPYLVTTSSRHFLYARVILMALVALSLTVLTGWTGQLSLGQFALVGLGGMSTYSLVQHRVAFPVAMVLAVLITAAAALLVGAPALRMRGLFLAVTTLALAVAAPWLLARPIFLDEDQLSPLLRRPTIGGVSLESQRAYYYFSLGILVLAIVVVARVRRSGLGRSLLAVRDNELAAAAVGISPARTKLFAFGLSGALAGLAGSALVGLLEQFTPDGFLATDSLIIVAIAVVGGLASITGALLGALFVVGLPAFFPDSPQVALLTSGAGVLILLLYFPGGFIQILFNLRDLALARAAARQPEVVERRPPVAEASKPTMALAERAPVPADLDHALRARGVRVRFGHRIVVDDVDLEVAPGEVVGLIGANGAGKSTFMNAVGGYLPNDGVIEVAGREVQDMSATRRARLGLGRTFQDAALFADLTVRETVQVALEDRARARFVTVALGLPRAKRIERAKQARADDILDLLGLGPYASRFVSELSTGMRRVVELACLLATDARVLCLDEPTAGIAQREAESFGPLLLQIRAELGASMLVIEHDMPLVMSLSDRIYCLETGRVIAAGTPEEVRHDPLVIASYLGTDDRAIARSNA